MTAQDTLRPLVIGAKAPAFTLTGVDGATYSRHSFDDKQLLAVIFLANHCPYVGSWEDRIVAIAREYANDVAFVGISSNSPERYPRDSPEEMRQRGYPFPYLFDQDQSVARSFGATRTPEVFLFDQDRVLRYHGAVDSDWEEGAGMQNYLRDALHRLLHTGLDVPMPQTPVVGCVIKYE